MRRRSTANQQAAGVSLFPFLAVLFCTMGAMIIVLVVIARHTRVKVAEEARRAAAAGESGELASQREDLEWRIDELKKSREETQKLLTDKQTELSHLEEHARRLKDQLEEAAAAREHFAELTAGDARQNEDLKKRLSGIQKDAERTRAEIDKLRRNGGGPGESYAIIPYRGPNETHRRPIYIECRKDAIVLQPEGVVLDVNQDFTIDLGPSNPLVSALRATSDYYNRQELAGKGPAGMPYPLFIVRPEGIQSWFVARLAISSWGTDFGYELVGQDWKFDFPPPEPRLIVAMREAIVEAKARQAMLAKAAPRLSHSTGHAVFRASQRGGIVQVDGSSAGGGRRARGRPGIAGRRGAGGGDGLGNGGSGLAGGGIGAGGLGGPRYNRTPQRLVATSGQNSGQNTGDGPVHSIDGDDNPYANALGGRGTGNGMPGGALGTPGGAGGSATGAPGAGAPGGAPGSGLAATGYGPNGSGNAPGYGLGQGSGPGYAQQPGSGYGQQPGSGFGQKPGTGLGGQPGSSLAQSGSRGNGNGPNGSSPGGSPSGKLLAMGGPLAGGRYPAGSRYGNGSGGNGDGQQAGGGLSPGGASPDGTDAGGTQPGDGGPGGTQPGGQAGGTGPGGTGPGGTGSGGTGSGGTEPGGTGSGGTVPGAIGKGGQVPGLPVPGGQFAGPTRPGGNGNGNTPQGSPQSAPGFGVPGNPGAQQTGNPSGSPVNPAAYQGQYASNPSSSRSRPGGSSARAGRYGPTGSGSSDPNGTDDQAADSNAAGGPDVAASPNGLAGAKAIGNGTTISESAGPSTRYGGAGGQSDSGSLSSSGSGTAQPGGRGSITPLNNTGGPNMNPIGQQLANSQNASVGSGQSSGGSAQSSSSSRGQQTSAMGGGSSSMMQPQGGMPSPNLNFGQQDQQASSPSKHHKHREKNWANPDAATTNVPIQRPIRIVCDADHLTLLPEGRGRQGMRVIPLKPQTSESLDDLVSTVWDRIDSWGTAGRNMYWRPTLVMEVEPGGERRYAELQALLANSGFDVHARPRTRALVGPRRPGPIR